MDVTREFWIEEHTGSIWAVELAGHEVVASCGPLLLEDADEELLDTYEYSAGGVRWLRAHAERFARFLPTLPEIPPT